MTATAFGRWMGLAGLGLSGCAGTFLTEVQAGYAISPSSNDTRHAGVLSAHLGGSEIPGFGLGLSGRFRAYNGGWSLPELGPQVFYMYENDEPWAFYLRGNALVGLANHDGENGPSIGGTLNPGFVFYPGDLPSGLTVSLTGEIHGIPLRDRFVRRGFVGLQFGYAIGGVKD
jgi:hypothetical protein